MKTSAGGRAGYDKVAIETSVDVETEIDTTDACSPPTTSVVIGPQLEPEQCVDSRDDQNVSVRIGVGVGLGVGMGVGMGVCVCVCVWKVGLCFGV